MAKPSRAGAAALFVLSLVVGPLLPPPLGGLLLITSLVLAVASRRTAPAVTSHGSARLAGWNDAARGGLLERDGLILGRADRLADRPGKRGAETLLRINKFTNLATFAPTGRGKGVSVLIPNLLSYRGSVVVTDPKAENYRITAAHRLKAFGQRQYRLDPFRLCGIGEDRLNPLDFIAETDIDFLEACRDLANQIVLRQGTEHEPHWNDSAEIIIYALIAYVCACEKADRNLITVRHILTSKQRLGRAVEVMQKDPRLHGVIAELGHLLTNYAGDELASILSTVQRHTAFLTTPVVAHCLSASSFEPRELRTAQGASVFLCLPAERLETLAPLMRLWVGTLLRATTRGTPTEKHPVLFLLDEAAHLGRIRLLEQAVTLMRGYGIRLWFFFQSLNQVKACYGEQASTILDNIDTQQFFGINCLETAEAISKRIGDATITVASRGESSNYSRPVGSSFGQAPQQASHSSGTSVTYSEMARRLLFPDEILRLPEDTSLLFHRNVPVVLATLLKYYEEPSLRRAVEGGTVQPLPAAPAPPRRLWQWLERQVRYPWLYLCSTALSGAVLASWTINVARRPHLPPDPLSVPAGAWAPPLTEGEQQIIQEGQRVAELERKVSEQAALGQLEQQRQALEAVLKWQEASRAWEGGAAACPNPARCPHARRLEPHDGFGPHWCPDAANCPHFAAAGR